jgi:enoyl-CoA hydratase
MSPQLESLTVEVKDNVAQVTLIGPGKGNAMGPEFWAEMPVVFAELDADPEVRAIVLTGSGNNFCFGLNLLTMGNTLSDTMANEVSAKPRTDFHTHLKHLQHSISAVADCRTPTIASIHGWCIGGGVDLISAVDIRYASADAKFSVREVKLSIVADVGSLARLPYILSDGHLRELALTGKDIDAARAEKIGLVNDVLPDAQSALAAAHATAAEIAGGVYESLLTSAAALTVAIPAFIAHSYISARVSDVLHDIERASIEMLEIIRGDQNTGKPL